MTSGGLCVMMAGTVLMLLWCVDSWDMQPLEVSANICELELHQLSLFLCKLYTLLTVQVELHIVMLSLVLVLGPSIWMMLLVLQVLVSCWSALADLF